MTRLLTATTAQFPRLSDHLKKIADLIYNHPASRQTSRISAEMAIGDFQVRTTFGHDLSVLVTRNGDKILSANDPGLDPIAEYRRKELDEFLCLLSKKEVVA